MTYAGIGGQDLVRMVALWVWRTLGIYALRNEAAYAIHYKIWQLENVAIANALQLEAARRRAVPIRFNTSPVPSLNSLSLSVAVFERIYC